MRLVDSNLLLYAIDRRSPHHTTAKAWMNDRLSGTDTLAFAWSTLLGFVRVGTNPRIFPNPLTSDEAIDYVDSWLAQPCTTVVDPTPRHAAILRELLTYVGTGGNLVPDADLAALAIEHGAELCSADHDFGRFPGVRWTNPLN